MLPCENRTREVIPIPCIPHAQLPLPSSHLLPRSHISSVAPEREGVDCIHNPMRWVLLPCLPSEKYPAHHQAGRDVLRSKREIVTLNHHSIYHPPRPYFHVRIAAASTAASKPQNRATVPYRRRDADHLTIFFQPHRFRIRVM